MTARQFMLHLSFAMCDGARVVPAASAEIREFLGMLPHVLPQVARPAVDFTTLAVDHVGPADLCVHVSVTPAATDEALYEDARRLGIRDPPATAARAAMMGWLQGLRRPTVDNPLHEIWRTWCATKGLTGAPMSAPLWLESARFVAAA
jgi:hypothetical protein